MHQPIVSDAETLAHELNLTVVEVETAIAERSAIAALIDEEFRDSANFVRFGFEDFPSTAGFLELTGSAPLDTVDAMLTRGIEVRDGFLFSAQERRERIQRASDGLAGMQVRSTIVRHRGDDLIIQSADPSVVRLGASQISSALGLPSADRGRGRVIVEAVSSDRIPRTRSAAERGMGMWTWENGQWYTCTTAFSVAERVRFVFDGLATAGHCADQGSYVWVYSYARNEWTLWVAAFMAPNSILGDIGRLAPVQQSQLDSWYGPGVYTEGDPQPTFMANITHGQRPVHGTSWGAFNEPVCLVGATSQSRRCNARIIDWDVDVLDEDGVLIRSQTVMSNGAMADGDSGTAVSFNYTIFGVFSSDDGIDGFFTPVWNWQVNTGYDMCTSYNYAC